jgi:FtsP/CotA-like multicopper oxidase with cupredoxin domain
VSEIKPGSHESTRREFLRRGATAAIAFPTLAATIGCERPAVAAPQKPAAAPAQPSHAAPAAASAASAAETMDAMHEKGVKAFPAATEGKGNQPLEPKIVGGVKVFELTAEEIDWEVSPGQRFKAWTYNRQLPGPQIRVKEGDRVRIILHNKLAESTVIHFHGLEVPNDQDGVPFITQPPVKPGASYTYEFTVPNAGSHMYHSHHNSMKQVGMGLLGAFIVEPKQPDPAHRADLDYVMILNDAAQGFTLNGKGFPATEPLVVKKGQTVRIRFMNEGIMIHPMHLHGMHMTVIAKDGWDQPAPWKCDTLNIAPGERWDVLVRATNPGTWAFHCHILSHAESPHGMFGMVTAMIVK